MPHEGPTRKTPERGGGNTTSWSSVTRDATSTVESRGVLWPRGEDDTATLFVHVQGKFLSRFALDVSKLETPKRFFFTKTLLDYVSYLLASYIKERVV